MVDMKAKNKPRRRRGRKDGKPQQQDLQGGGDAAAAAVGAASTASSSLKYQPHGSLLIQLTEDAPTWYECAAQQADRNATVTTDPAPTKVSNNTAAALVPKYRALGDEIYAREVQLFSKKQQQTAGNSSSSSSDQKWVESTMRKGTLKDRIAAMSVVVSTDPVHKFYALDGLLQMAGCTTESGQYQETNSRVAQLAAEAIEDLFLNTFLPSRRKLLTLEQRPLHLFEKQQQQDEEEEQQQHAGDGGADEGTKSKKKKKKKKKTQRTLSPRILLLWRFEEMVKSKYQMFLRQYLGHTLQEGVELQKIPAVRLAATLFRSVPEGEETLLPLLVNKLGDPGKKVAAAAGHELRRVLEQHPVMQKVVAREVQQLAHRPHLSSRALYNCIIFLNQLRLRREDDNVSDNNNEKKSSKTSETSLPASLISTYFRLFEVTVNKKKKTKHETGNPEDGMKSRLLSALLAGVNRAHPYLPKRDQTMEQHIDALYRLVHTAPPAACTQALLLLFHLAIGSRLLDDHNHRHHHAAGNDGDNNNNKALSEEEKARQNRFYRALYSTLSEAALLNSGKHLTMFFNILYKAMKYDTDENRVGAFAKRIAATTMHASSAVAAASLFLMNEITKTHPTLLASFQEILEGNDATMYLDCTKRDPRGALVSSSKDDSTFASRKQDANTLRRAPGWELSLSLNHYHPSVRKFASSMGEEISYTGDPLKDFALVPFLDKFAYRNPKSAQRVAAKYKRGESVAERRSATESMIQSQFALPVNDPSFLNKQDVGPEDEFFHRFFVARAKRDEIKGIVRHREAKDVEGEEAEVEALDAAEDEVVGDSFDKYETQWDTDSDEEAFVDSLAEKIIEDAAGPVDLDDEDPDMDDWGDLYDDDDEEEAEEEAAGDDDSDEDEKDGNVGATRSSSQHKPDDDDAFMDDSGEEDESDLEQSFDFNEDMLAHDGEEEGGSEDDAMFLPEDESSVDSDEEAGKGRKKLELDTFAPAEDYEERVNKSWSELKRARPPLREDDEEEGPPPRASKKSAKRKGKRRKM